MSSYATLFKNIIQFHDHKYFKGVELFSLIKTKKKKEKRKMLMQGREEPSLDATTEPDFEVEPWSGEEEEEDTPTTTRKKRKSRNNKRRFSDEQVKSLETIFESETKLDPRKKVQVARELGLQPRQVAIWFQNKRARWKTKQIEKNYRVLKSNYDNLKVRLEGIKKERESLLQQVCLFLVS